MKLEAAQRRQLTRQVMKWVAPGSLTASFGLLAPIQGLERFGAWWVTVFMILIALGGLIAHCFAKRLNLRDRSTILALCGVSVALGFSRLYPLVVVGLLFLLYGVLLIHLFRSLYAQAAQLASETGWPGLIRSPLESLFALTGALVLLLVNGLRCYFSVDQLLVATGLTVAAFAFTLDNGDAASEVSNEPASKVWEGLDWGLVLLWLILAVEVFAGAVSGGWSALFIAQRVADLDPTLRAVLPGFGTVGFLASVALARWQAAMWSHKLGRPAEVNIAIIRVGAIAGAAFAIALAFDPDPRWSMALFAGIGLSVANWCPSLLALAAERRGKDGVRSFAFAGPVAACVAHCAAGSALQHPSGLTFLLAGLALLFVVVAVIARYLRDPIGVSRSAQS